MSWFLAGELRSQVGAPRLQSWCTRGAFAPWGDCGAVLGPTQRHRGAEVMLGTQHPGQALPSLQFHRDAAPCPPLSGFVPLSPLQTPVGNREPIFELCKVFFC